MARRYPRWPNSDERAGCQPGPRARRALPEAHSAPAGHRGRQPVPNSRGAGPQGEPGRHEDCGESKRELDRGGDVTAAVVDRAQQEADGRAEESDDHAGDADDPSDPSDLHASRSRRSRPGVPGGRGRGRGRPSCCPPRAPRGRRRGRRAHLDRDCACAGVVAPVGRVSLVRRAKDQRACDTSEHALSSRAGTPSFPRFAHRSPSQGEIRAADPRRARIRPARRRRRTGPAMS
jgi:hypothetical protein